MCDDDDELSLLFSLFLNNMQTTYNKNQTNWISTLMSSSEKHAALFICVRSRRNSR